MLQKAFLVKFYGSDGSFKRTIPNELIKNGPPSFSSRIGGGLGELVLDLNLPWDDFDEGYSIAFLNIVDVYAVDADNPRGRRIYRGFISRYAPYLDSTGNGVRVTCLGLYSLLTRLHYKNGSSFSVTHSAQDPETILRAIADYFETVYPGLLSYSNASTDAVGTNVSYVFTDLKCADAMKKATELAGPGFWSFVDADGILNFRAKPVAASHTFVIGRDIDSLVATKDGEKVINDVTVRRSGNTETNYADATSITTYGRRTQLVSDSTITDVTTADQRGAKLLSDSKDAKISARITLNTNYDLEAVRVGECVRIANFDKDNDFFGSNVMQIVGTTYRGSSLDIELEQVNSDLGSELAAFVNV